MKFAVGQDVVYLKTGTEGKIVKLYELDGKNWAELDTTGLLYEENALELVKASKKGLDRKERTIKSAEREERETEDGLREIKDEGRPDGSGTVGGGG